MKATILLFSPSGHTKRVGEMIGKACEKKGATVKVVDIRKRSSLLAPHPKESTIKETLGQYDLLFIGGPIYAGHIERHLMNLIKALPRPSEEEGRSNIVVPFVTYGGAHSFMALEEMGKTLKKKNFQSIMGLKVAAFHTLSGEFSHPILLDRPGKGEEELVEQCVSRAIEISNHKETALDASKSFKYTPFPFRIVLRFLTQEKIHKKYQTLSVNSNCVQCKKCISACPVNNIILKDGKITFGSDCILCGECFHSCDYDAILFDYPQKAKKILEDGKIELESPLSCIYPK